MELHKKVFEDASVIRGIGALINHFPSKANCRLSINRNNRCVIVASKNIRNGDELYLNYGRQYKLHENVVATSTNKSKFKV